MGLTHLHSTHQQLGPQLYGAVWPPHGLEFGFQEQAFKGKENQVEAVFPLMN